MTIVSIPEVAQERRTRGMPRKASLVATDPECRARLHGTETAWRNHKCRCPEARKAHDKILRKRRCGPQVDDQGRCVARIHGSLYAYKTAGCRCPEAIAKFEERRGWNRAYEDKRNAHLRAAAASRTAVKRIDAAYRHWNGAHTRVGEVGVLLARMGFPQAATTRERMVVALTWTTTPNRSSGKPLTNAQVAERWSMSTEKIRGYLNAFAELRAGRTDRRLAEARWRAVHKHGQMPPVPASEPAE